MKKILKIFVIVTFVIILCGCGKNDAKRFKEEYESLNGIETKTEGVTYYSISIGEDNPFVYAKLEDINKKIENKETFIVYFGSNWCSWCRNILPTVINVLKEENIKTVYYIDIRPNNDIKNDIRDIFEKDENGKVYISHKGTDAYHEFIKLTQNILPNYSYQGVSVENTEYAGTKRVGIPCFMIIKEGVAKAKTSGISTFQTDPYMDLTTEITENIKQNFKEFLKNIN